MMMKPGFAPSGLALEIVHGPAGSSGGSSPQAPWISVSRSSGPRESRLPYQLESGTSSMAFTFTAAPAGSTAKKRASGRKSIWSAPSQAKGEKYVSGIG